MTTELLGALVSDGPDPVCVKDAESRILLCNRVHGELFFGISDPSEARGKTDADYFGAEVARVLRLEEARIIATGQPLVNRMAQIEHRRLGTRVFLLEHKIPTRNAAGHVTGLVAVCRDITARKTAEAAQRKELELLRTLIDNVPDFMFIKDGDSRFIINNRAHLSVIGAANQAEAIARTDFDFFPRELASRYFTDERRVIEHGQSIVDHEEPVSDQDGNEIWLSTTKVPLRDERGGTVGLVGISRDITHRKRAEQEKRTLEEQLHQSQKLESIGQLAGGGSPTTSTTCLPPSRDMPPSHGGRSTARMAILSHSSTRSSRPRNVRRT